MQIKKINKFEKIELLSFNEILEKGISKVKGNQIEFNALGLKNVITGLATIALSKFKINDYQDLLRVFNNISKPGRKSPLKYITREYLERQFLVRDEITDFKFKELLKKEYDNSNFLEDVELNDFISEEVLDELHLIRNWEYGNYCLNRFVENIFEQVSQDSIEKFDELLKDNNLQVIDVVDPVLVEILKKHDNKFNSIFYEWILLIFDRKFSEIKSYIIIDYKYANFLKKKGGYIEKQYPSIISVCEKIINNGLSKKQKKKRTPKIS